MAEGPARNGSAKNQNEKGPAGEALEGKENKGIADFLRKKMRIRIIARFKNEHFIEAREQAGFPTQVAMAKATGIGQTTISAYECFRAYPHNAEQRRLVETATGRLFEEMFPKLYCDAVDRKLGRPIQQVLTVQELPAWTQPKMIGQNPESLYDLKELKQEIITSLNTLTPRESRILQMRFGMGDEREMSFEEIAERLGLTRERIRQIEAKALRKLKHPSRSRNLKPFAGIDRHPGYKVRCPVCGQPPSYASPDYYFCGNYSCLRQRWMTEEGKKKMKGRRLQRKKREEDEYYRFVKRPG